MEADLKSLEKLRGGDEEGLRELILRHREPLFRFVYRFVRNEADAAELTEETFYKVYKNAKRYRPKAAVGTWIFAIAGNLCRDFLRRNRHRRDELSLNVKSDSRGEGELGETLAASANLPVEEAISRERLELIGEAIQGLPYKLKFPFIFCVLENNSYDRCAEVLQTSRKTVEMRIYRARRLLQEALEEFLHPF